MRRHKKHWNCRCIEEPRGRNGLEGFCLDQKYVCEFRECHDGNYWRVWPEFDPEWSNNYYETCGPGVFKRFFVLL